MFLDIEKNKFNLKRVNEILNHVNRGLLFIHEFESNKYASKISFMLLFYKNQHLLSICFFRSRTLFGS